MSTPMHEPLLGGGGNGGGGSGSQTPTGTSQGGQFSPGTLTRTSSWGGGGPSGDDTGASSSAPLAGGFNSGGGGPGPGYYTRLESLARRKPGQPVRESARAR